MSFDSIAYLIFLTSVALLYRLCPSKKRWIVLLLSGLIFYGSSGISLTLLLAAVIASSYLSGILLEAAKGTAARRAVLTAQIVICIGLLGYFKYFNFLGACISNMFSAEWQMWDIVLPVGCSFYTFQAMSYTVDVYRKQLQAERHFGYFALYISFFPQLVAGPIERAGDLIPQLKEGRSPDISDIKAGIRLLLSGFFRKVVAADFCGIFASAVYGANSPDGSAVFIGTLLFGIQIYCDFAGYSEIAAGSARLLGVRLMRNFDRPYLSCSLREFWHKWHISLSKWLTDYIYIPLGGSRRGMLRQILATLAVFAVSGIWHGADLTFIAWGLFHGVFMVLEILIGRSKKQPRTVFGKVIGTTVTFSLVSFSWILFRANDLAHAGLMISRLFSQWNIKEGIVCLGISGTNAARLLLTLASFPLLHNLSLEDADGKFHDMTYIYLLFAIISAWLLRLREYAPSAFIYFQF